VIAFALGFVAAVGVGVLALVTITYAITVTGDDDTDDFEAGPTPTPVRCTACGEVLPSRRDGEAHLDDAHNLALTGPEASKVLASASDADPHEVRR